ncbi:MAG TPA: TolC family protein [Acidobacteriota bacterium]|nr:TolC family protein [Acidobacteriota bacterium]
MNLQILKRRVPALCLVVLGIALGAASVWAQDPQQEQQQEPIPVPPESEVNLPSQSGDEFELVEQSYVERVKEEGAFIELSVRDAIRMALANNLEISIENFQEEINRVRLVGTKGFYDPEVSFDVGIRSSESPSISVLDAGQGIPVSTRDTFSWSSSFTQQVPYGGRLTVNLDNSRFESNSLFSTLNPSFGTEFSIQYTQPLWRGFIRTATKRQIKLQNLDLELSDLQFELKVSDVVRRVMDRYWDLVQAIESNDAERRSMNLAVVRYQDSTKRVEIGIEAPIEITSARSEVAGREQSFIQSEVAIVNADADLKNLLAPDPNDSLWDLRLIPRDRPKVEQIGLDLRGAINLALQRRPELTEYQKRLEQVEINREFYKKEGKPRVDLNLSYGSTGQAGQAFARVGVDLDGDGIPDDTTNVPDPDSPFQGNFSNSLSSAFGFDFTNYNISATVTIPLRNRANDANLANQAIEERRLLSQLRMTQQQISVEVRKAFRQIEIQSKRLEAARVARELAEEQLDGENKRFEAGLSTNFEVLRIQRDLAEAIQAELVAKIDYVKSITALRQATYTLVENTDIVLARTVEEQ